MKQISENPEALKISTLQVVFDTLMVHENDLLGKDGGDNVRHLTIHIQSFRYAYSEREHCKLPYDPSR